AGPRAAAEFPRPGTAASYRREERRKLPPPEPMRQRSGRPCALFLPGDRATRYKKRAVRKTGDGGILAGFDPFEKRKMFQRVYCSMGTPSYISSTRKIWVSRL